jgi:hypothetical protein
MGTVYPKWKNSYGPKFTEPSAAAANLPTFSLQSALIPNRSTTEPACRMALAV